MGLATDLWYILNRGGWLLGLRTCGLSRYGGGGMRRIAVARATGRPDLGRPGPWYAAGMRRMVVQGAERGQRVRRRPGRGGPGVAAGRE